MAFDTVIIGGGTIGCSVAYHLADAGHEDVLLVERDQLGSGTSGQSAGVIDHQFDTEVRVKLTQESIDTLERFEELTGVDPEFHQVGYLVVSGSESNNEYVDELVDLQRRLGVEVRELDASDVAEFYPGANVDDIERASFTPRDGYINGQAVVNGFAERARDGGVEMRTQTPVEEVLVEDGEVTGVAVPGETIAADRVICATGAWTPVLADQLGVRIPLRAFMLHLFVTEPMEEMKGEKPVLIDTDASAYFRPESPTSGELWMGIYDSEPGSIDLRERDWENFSMNSIGARESVRRETIDAAIDRFPFVADSGLANEWVGLPTYTPDGLPIVDEAPSISDLYFVAAGGIGVMHAPAVGQLAADRVLDGESDVLPLSELAIDRFDRQEVPDAIFSGEYGE